MEICLSQPKLPLTLGNGINLAVKCTFLRLSLPCCLTAERKYLQCPKTVAPYPVHHIPPYRKVRALSM